MANLNPNGSVAGNAQNIPEAHVPRTRSTFPLKRHFFNTHRFGEYIPHFFADLNKDEDFPINSSHTLRTYTLKSPLMQNVTRNKDYFLVPMEAILPNNWEKFFDNPVRGDDVLDDVGPTVENFWNKVGALMQATDNALATILQDNTTTAALTIQAFFRHLILGEYFYSNGSLLSSLGCHGNPYCIVYDNRTFDDYFDAGISSFILEVSSLINTTPGVLSLASWFTLNVDGFTYSVNLEGKSDTSNRYFISLRHALQLMRDNPTFTISNVHTNIVNGISTFKSNLYNKWYDSIPLTYTTYNVDCNLSRLWAYQLSIAHYMTNDHIDFVYSAELYRQLIGYYVKNFLNSAGYTGNMFFTRNGVSYQYDFLSAHCASLALTIGATRTGILTATSGVIDFGVLGFLSALFGYRRSLRYLDYFTGSRAQPLGMASTQNTNVTVSSNLVDVLDITRNIQKQRFFNSVNRVRHNFEGYLKGIFGGEVPAPDYHNPFKLAHTDDVIFGQETENTGSAQLSPDNSTDVPLPIAITTNLRSNSGNYIFNVHTDRPCICIGITSYEITRIYTRSMDRSFLHKNRFDWFNPFMQYIGDQPVYLQELGINPNAGLASLKNFAYAIRHEEYKQWFNIGSGGFCVPSTDLDNWIFVAKDARGDQDVINPDWIRSLNAEFDQFYVVLSGWSLGTYFHFIVDDFNSVQASRPMAFAPQILG